MSLTDLRRRTSQDLYILGGKIAPDRLEALLAAMPTGLKWAICEYPDRFALTDDDAIQLEHLLRMRRFGPDGDLEIRYDDKAYHWRFIGGSRPTLPDDIIGQDFWQHSNIPHLIESETTIFLWGQKEQDGDSFKEGKVARADLSYPVSKDARYATIKARVYTYAGRPQFAWYEGLEGCK